MTKVALVAGISLALCRIMPAQAQTQGSMAAMPQAAVVDGNSVNLLSPWGHWFIYDVAPISIGPADQDPIMVDVTVPSFRDSFTSHLRVADPQGIDSVRESYSVGKRSWSILYGASPSAPGVREVGGAYYDESLYGKGWMGVADRDGTIYRFDIPSWYPVDGPNHLCATKIIKLNGEILTFSNEDNYNIDQCRVRSVTSNRGYQIRYEYSSGGGPRSKITLVNTAYEYCDPDTTMCSLSMAWPSIDILQNGNQSTFSNGNGRTWIYGTGGLTLPGNATASIAWYIETFYPGWPPSSIEGRVTSVVRDGQTWTYSYPASDPILGSGPPGSIVRVQDPSGNVRRYARRLGAGGGDPSTGEWELPSRLEKVVDENGQVTTYNYNAQELLSEVIYPEGNRRLVTYDANGSVLTSTIRAKPGSGLSDLTTTYTYGQTYGANDCCDRPLSITDPKGNVTEFTYDPVHKGVLTETGPAPSPGAPRPVKRYNYSQHYAWVKNSSGAYVQAATPVWMLDSMKTCRTSATVSGSCAAGTSDEVTVSYDYGTNAGPNNLWLRGKVETADGTSLRTCYSYDRLGNKISQTSPRAGLTNCP